MLSDSNSQVEGHLEVMTAEETGVELCAVCGDKASGYHYNVLSCEGCKGFFRRSVHKSLTMTCRYGGSCEVTVSNRRRCPPCRFTKCLTAGMLESCLLTEYQCNARGSRRRMIQLKMNSDSTLAPPTKRVRTTSSVDDSLSTHILHDQKPTIDQSPRSLKLASMELHYRLSTDSRNGSDIDGDCSVNNDISSSGTRSNSICNSLSYSSSSSNCDSESRSGSSSGSSSPDHSQDIDDLWFTGSSDSESEKLSDSLAYPLYQEKITSDLDNTTVDMGALLTGIKLFHKRYDELHEGDTRDYLQEGEVSKSLTSPALNKLNLTIISSKFVADFAKLTVGFDGFDISDQVSLIKGSIFSSMALQMYMKYEPSTDCTILPDGNKYSVATMCEAGMQAPAEGLFSFCKSMVSMKTDPMEVALMTCICLYSESTKVKDLERVQKIQGIYSKVLASYCNLKAGDGCARFAKLIMKLIGLKEMSILEFLSSEELTFTCEHINGKQADCLSLPQPLQQYYECMIK